MSDQGRNADILQSIVDDVPYTDPPQSRIEDLLLQVKEVIEEGGGTKIKLADVSGAAVATLFSNATLTWSDPEDIVVSGATLAKWAGTKVLRKAGSAPESITDGVVVVDSKVKNQYSSNGYEDTGLEYGVMYYYRWFPYTEDGVVTDGSAVSVTPERTKITTIPTQAGTLTYDGTEQTAVWNDYDSSKMTVTGNTATNAGTYTAQFTPKDGYCWDDDTITAKAVQWAIDKATGVVTLSESTISLNADTTYADITITATGGGALSVESSDTTVATVGTIEDNVFRVTADEEGTATVTVTMAASDNYTAATSAVTVKVQYLAIVTWTDGTDEQIKAMIDAADRGEINLSDYWSVGDERTVHLSAMTKGNSFTTPMPEQNVVLVLMNEGYPGDGNESVNFVWGQKSRLVYGAKMNTSNTTEGSWNSCAARQDLNSKYYNALPFTFRQCLKKFNVITAKTYNGSTNQTSNNYISLFAEKEVFGAQTYSNETEAAALFQMEYYKTESNTEGRRWLRSPYKNDSAMFCTVRSGNPNGNYASNPDEIIPFGCI